MKPVAFDYYCPATLEEALNTLASLGYNGKVIAGGQSLVPAMNFRMAQPAALVDINKLTELDYIRPAQDGGVLIGALTRDSKLENDPLIAERAPMFRAALPHLGHPQIRNRGTVGGSVAHADPAGQIPLVVTALNARFRVMSQKGERSFNVEEFFVTLFTTAMTENEILVEIAIPPLPKRSGWSYHQVARQHGAAVLVGIGAVVAVDDKGRCSQARLAYLGVGEKPEVAIEAGKSLIGQAPIAEAFDAVAATALEKDLDPGSDIHSSTEYRRHLVKILTRRALTEAFERALKGRG